MNVQERRHPPAIPDRNITNQQRKCSRGATENLCQEDEQEGGGERHGGVRCGRKDNEKERAKTRSTKDVKARDATDGITSDCDDILAFLQVVALKSPQV